jgi:hypothetical protein
MSSRFVATMAKAFKELGQCNLEANISAFPFELGYLFLLAVYLIVLPKNFADGSLGIFLKLSHFA